MVAALTAGTVLGGCAGSLPVSCEGRDRDRIDGPFAAVPSPRIGGLPFPGLTSLYTTADPASLGSHVYRSGVPFEGLAEVDRGTVYTELGGFLDIAHVRNTVDAAAHIHERLAYAADRGLSCARFRLAEPSVYRVELDGGFDLLGPEELVDLSCGIAFDALNWHEILTWAGYRSTLIIPETGSAFTYEDVASHAVGAAVAAAALRAWDGVDSARFGAAVDAALAAELGRLGGLDTAGTREAIAAGEGVLWSGGEALARPVMQAMPARTVAPVLVGGEGRAAGAELRVPRGPAAVRVLIEPRVMETGKIAGVIEESGGVWNGVVDVERDYPVLLEAIGRDIAPQGRPAAP